MYSHGVKGMVLNGLGFIEGFVSLSLVPSPVLSGCDPGGKGSVSHMPVYN